MDVPFHEVAQRLINHSMPRHGALAAEGFRNYREMPGAAPGGSAARVARMLLAFVAQFQRYRRERCEPLPHRLFDGMHHGAGPAGGSAPTAGFAGSSSGR